MCRTDARRIEGEIGKGNARSRSSEYIVGSGDETGTGGFSRESESCTRAYEELMVMNKIQKLVSAGIVQVR
ncbi:unnamed protein product [Thlaspi arvense]|uniref:Uncharacterized protein n=1 Tax=Thlaspi arvense TaxID=13288 RepID=A0AAU9SDI8_THLAR|nr:unnamed protein product [Thlaspi arvense]